MSVQQDEIDELRIRLNATMLELGAERIFARAIFALLLSNLAAATGNPMVTMKELREAVYRHVDKTQLPGAEDPLADQLAEEMRETARGGVDRLFQHLAG